MSEITPRRPSIWKDAFSRGAALEQASNYAELGFWSKSKNVLTVFFLGVSCLTILVALYGGIEGLSISDVWLDVLFYVFLTPFIFMNHRWAMIVSCSLYAVSKILLIASGIGTPITHLIFLWIAAGLTFQSVVVANNLRSNTKRKKSTDPIDRLESLVRTSQS